MKILVTGGTTFVSRYVAEYFVEAGEEVYVLNRNFKSQVAGVKLIQGDRHKLDESLGEEISAPVELMRGLHFDAVIDVTAYNATDVNDLLDGMNGVCTFDQFILISSSAVYPETGEQPFKEDSQVGPNSIWKGYGTDKIAAEAALLARVPEAYILRPPYLYGPWNNVYREAFAFDCAESGRKFYLPGEGEMKLQFFHVRDLCRLMEVLLEKRPEDHILNVGNPEAISIKDWVTMCYKCFHREPEFANVWLRVEQRAYFSFYDYEYVLDVDRQRKYLPELTDLQEGLEESAQWYVSHRDAVNRKPLLQFIDDNLA